MNGSSYFFPKKVREGFRMNMYNTELGAGSEKENGVPELQIFENQVFGQRKPEAKFFNRIWVFWSPFHTLQ